MSKEMHAEDRPSLTEKQLGAKSRLLQSGDAAFDAEEFERALDCYHRASLIDAGDPRIWNSLGLAYHNLDFHREAWRSYKLSLQSDPDNIDTLWYAGEFLFNMDDKQLALIILSRYLELETDQEKKAEAEEMLEELRSDLALLQQSKGQPALADPNADPLEEQADEDEFEGFEVEGETIEEELDEFDDFDDEFHEGDEELENSEEFVANLSLQLTTMDSKCLECRTPIPHDAPYCYSCKAPHFYE